MDRVINAYRTFENRKSGLDNWLVEIEVFVPPPEQLKESKVWRYALHNDKIQTEAKEEVFVPPPEQLKEAKVRRYVFHNEKRQAEAKEEVLSHHLKNFKKQRFGVRLS